MMFLISRKVYAQPTDAIASPEHHWTAAQHECWREFIRQKKYNLGRYEDHVEDGKCW